MVVAAEGARAGAALTAGFSVSSGSSGVSLERPVRCAGTVVNPATAADVPVGRPAPCFGARTKSAAGAEEYINDLVTGSQPKFDAEVAELRKLKASETRDPNAQIKLWDFRYYQNQLKKQKYAVDTEALRVYFPFQKMLEGMFNIYQSIFGLKFEKIAVPQKWIDDLQLYAISDTATGEPLGMFYLDMFPREGKFNHFAEFEIIGGKLLPSGKYQRPTVALLCNFPPPSEG